MPMLIDFTGREPTLCENDWQIVSADDFDPNTLPTGNALLPLVAWNDNATALAQHKPVALWLDSHEQASDIRGDVHRFSLIAVNFPLFSDGRGYSAARQLRDVDNYKGELRAIGDVLPDQLFYYKRCGFDSFALREDKDPERALQSFDDFSLSYQGASDDSQPVFRRRFR